MDGENGQRIAIKFCFKAGLSVTETRRWYSRFRDGRELVEDVGRVVRPKSTRTGVNIAAVADFVKNDLESHQE